MKNISCSFTLARAFICIYVHASFRAYICTYMDRHKEIARYSTDEIINISEIVHIQIPILRALINIASTRTWHVTVNVSHHNSYCVDKEDSNLPFNFLRSHAYTCLHLHIQLYTYIHTYIGTYTHKTCIK